MNRVRWVAALVFSALVTGCGYPPPREVTPGVYRLQFCENEQKCFDAMKKTCPNGFRVTKYGPMRPEEFACQS